MSQESFNRLSINTVNFRPKCNFYNPNRTLFENFHEKELAMSVNEKCRYNDNFIFSETVLNN